MARASLRWLLVVLPLLVMSSCGITEPEEILTLYVAPQTAACTGVGPQQCLLVRESPQGEWSYFYSSIEGFTHEPGYSFTLRVLRRRIANPPADGSSLAYRLLEILSREPAPAT